MAANHLLAGMNAWLWTVAESARDDGQMTGADNKRGIGAEFDAIVLAGGAAARLGGVTKPQVTIAGMSLLDRVLSAVAQAQRVIVVGPQQPVAVREVQWAREQPPGGGPVAGVAAAFPATAAEIVLVLAADLPYIAGALPLLFDAVSLSDEHAPAAVLVDADGHINFLAAAWRRDALGEALLRVGPPHGVAAKRLLTGLTPALVDDTGGWGADCDTWDDVRSAREAADRALR